MKIFVATSYSSKVDYGTGEVFPEYKEWLEDILTMLERQGHTVFCALRADQYKINGDDPVAAFYLDMKHINESDVILALLSDKVSAGVQTEIGVGVALKKKVIISHAVDEPLAYFNAAMAKTGVVNEMTLPLSEVELKKLLS